MALNTHSLDLELDSSQYAIKNDPVGMDGLTAITLESWFKAESLHTTSLDRDVIAAYGTRAALSTQVVQLMLHGDGTNVKLRGLVGDTSGGGRQTVIDGSTNIVAGVWYHGAITYDGSNLNLYLNGSSDASPVALSGATLNSPSGVHDSFFVGCIGITSETNIGDYFDGKLDEIRFWNDARTSAELDDNKSLELNGNEAGFVSYWKFNNDYTDSQTAGNNNLTPSGSPVFSTDVPFVGTAEGGNPMFFSGGGVTVG